MTTQTYQDEPRQVNLAQTIVRIPIQSSERAADTYNYIRDKCHPIQRDVSWKFNYNAAGDLVEP